MLLELVPWERGHPGRFLRQAIHDGAGGQTIRPLTSLAEVLGGLETLFYSFAGGRGMGKRRIVSLEPDLVAHV